MNDIEAARPRLAPGVDLVGPMEGVGFEESQWLVERDGQFVQVSEVLYRVCERADGEHSLEDLAKYVTESTEWIVTPEQVGQLLERKLMPLGIVDSDEDYEPGRDPVADLLKVGMRRPLFGRRVLDPLTGVLRLLHAPAVLLPAVVGIVLAHLWAYGSGGITEGIVDLLSRPLLLLPLTAVLALSGLFHELGHASALRYGGGRARTIGVGFYLIYPMLYTDTSEAYRLGRRDRIRVDLGGFYFHQLFAAALVPLAFLIEQPFLLVLALLVDLEMVRQLLFPFVRFDGYWLLADLTGIPDPLSAALPFLRRMAGREGAQLASLRPRVRRIFAAYVGLAAVVLPGLLYLFVTRSPEMVAVAWASLRRQADLFFAAFDAGHILEVLTSGVQILLLMLPVLGIAYMVVRLARAAVSIGRAVRSVRAVRREAASREATYRYRAGSGRV